MTEVKLLPPSASRVKWFFYEATIPMALVLLLWIPLGGWLFSGKSFLFERIIGSGDLLAVCFALLMAAHSELVHNCSTLSKTDFWFNVHSGISALMITAAGITYGFIKYFHSNFNFPDASMAQQEAEKLTKPITEMATFSLWFAAATLAFGYVLKYWIEAHSRET